MCTATGRLKTRFHKHVTKRGIPRHSLRRISMQKYVCTVCGYEYDPAEHDNVPFDQLPDDWCCPVCGVSKDQFSPA